MIVAVITKLNFYLLNLTAGSFMARYYSRHGFQALG